MEVHKTVQDAADKYGVDVELTEADPFCDELVYKASYNPAGEYKSRIIEKAPSGEARSGVAAVKLVAEKAGLS